MELTLVERMALLNILPQQGGITTLRILRDLRGELSFTEKELKDYGIKNRILPEGGALIEWSREFDSVSQEIGIGEAAHGIIVAQLQQLDKQGLLREQALTLWEKFVEKSKEP